MWRSPGHFLRTARYKQTDRQTERQTNRQTDRKLVGQFFKILPFSFFSLSPLPSLLPTSLTSFLPPCIPSFHHPSLRSFLPCSLSTCVFSPILMKFGTWTTIGTQSTQNQFEMATAFFLTGYHPNHRCCWRQRRWPSSSSTGLYDFTGRQADSQSDGRILKRRWLVPISPLLLQIIFFSHPQ